MVINVRLVYKIDLDSLPAFQVINKKETLIIKKLFCLNNYVIMSMPKDMEHFVSIKSDRMHNF